MLSKVVGRRWLRRALWPYGSLRPTFSLWLRWSRLRRWSGISSRQRRDCALAGIAAYLVVDPRDGRRELTMYEERGSDGLFVDVDPAESVTVTIAGREIAVDDRLP